MDMASAIPDASTPPDARAGDTSGSLPTAGAAIGAAAAAIGAAPAAQGTAAPAAQVGPDAAGEAPAMSNPSGSGRGDDPSGTSQDDGPAELAADAPVEERVRRLVTGLEGIEHLPLAEHAPRYADVHTQLQGALTEIDGESGG
jgi:hypothetical protein